MTKEDLDAIIHALDPIIVDAARERADYLMSTRFGDLSRSMNDAQMALLSAVSSCETRTCPACVRHSAINAAAGRVRAAMSALEAVPPEAE